LEPLRQRARALKAIGAAGLARQAIAAARGKPVDDKPPTGGGSPVLAETTPEDATDTPEPRQLRAVTVPREMAATNVRSKSRRRRRVRTPNTRTASAEVAVRQVWQPGMSVGELQAAANIGRSTASKWSKILATEASQQVAQ